MYRPATLGNYGSNGTDIDYLGHIWGWLDYEDELTAEQADASAFVCGFAEV